MKNKLAVMIVTFLVLIVLTPFIFGKLMNSRFNTMILELQQNKGVVAKEIKNKSSYLTTDRVFEVTIPGSVINDAGIKYIKLLTEVKFKNLPVTNVFFHNIVKDVELESGEKIPFFKDKIIFDITTPNFKTYAFVIKPVKYQTFTLNKITGTFNIKNNIVKLYINNVLAKNKNIQFNLNNLSSVVEKDKHFFKSENKFNLKVKFMDKEITLNNVDIFNSFDIGKKTLINFKTNLKKLSFAKIFEVSDFGIKVKIYDVNSTLFVKSINSQNKNVTLAMLANGLKIDLNSSLKALKFLSTNEGGFTLNIKTVIHKADSLNDFQLNPDKFITLNIKADISKKLADMISNYFPQMSSFFNTKPDKNGILHIKINFDRGQIK